MDHFKNINDNHGHLVGDSILKEIGRILNRQKRDIDFLGRYGGEEFVMVLKTDALFKLNEMLEDFRSKVEMNEFQVSDFSLKLTVSFGAFFKPKETKMTYQETIESADNLLYLAKQKGRNRVVIDSL
jgi:diguanylate cyclase (GGDEF)-like protein